jgi:hypothetical protein
MCPSGNGKSIGENDEAVQQLDATTTSSHQQEADDDDDDDGNVTSHSSNGKDRLPVVSPPHEGSDDETSDPIVVSPASSPLASVGDDVGGEEIFEDAKADEEQTTCRIKISPLSPSFVAMGLQRKATPLTLKSWTALALTLDGRDKLTKVFQYAARLLAWWFASGNSGGNQHLAIRFTALYKSLSNSRKAFRLGRSLMEIEKLRTIGLGRLIVWHVRQNLGIDDDDDEDRSAQSSSKKQQRPPKPLTRRASSNIGWGPMTLDEEDGIADGRRRTPSFVRSLSSKAYRTIYRPLRSTLSSVMGGGSSQSRPAPTAELWTVIGSAFKMIGLLGFWTGDNINYLCSTGFLDDHSLPTAEERLAKRSKLQSLSSIRANQTYFGGSVAGLLVSAYSYMNYRRQKLVVAQQQWEEACDDDEGEEEQEQALHHLKKVKEKQFSLFLALLKVRFGRIGCCLRR